MTTDLDVDRQSGSHLLPATLVQVQYLRGIAALLVVYFHTKVYDPQFSWHFDRSYGYGGVDIFFVISGLIMTLNSYGAPQPPGKFLLRRFVRIYPIYWFATTCGVFLFLAMPSVFLKDRIDGWYIFYSYLLLPFNSVEGTTHGVPFLKIAWTLIFEIYFYLVFAASLFVSRPGARACIQAVFIVSMVVYGYVGRPSSAPMGFYTAPLTIEFLFGCLAGLLVGAGASRFPRWLYGVLFSCSCLLFVSGGGHGDHMARVFYFGLPAMAIVGTAALFEMQYGRCINSRLLKVLGDASYATYLFHPFVLIAIRIATTHGLRGSNSVIIGAAGVCFSVISCAAAGVALHFMIERPLLAMTRRLIENAAGIRLGTTIFRDRSDGRRTRIIGSE